MRTNPDNGSALSGIRIESSAISPANDNIIGGDPAHNHPNRIRYNDASGIRIISGTGNRIFDTLLHENTPLEQGGLVAAAAHSQIPLASPLTLAILAVMLAAAGFIASRSY
ncbi:MAG TPA: hypothetical protein VGF48_01835 [Thermoanaerobaculia bacterium]